MSDTSAAAPLAIREYRYWAFISYSHVDEAWANWLHRGIETYTVPRPLVGTAIPNDTVVRPRRLFPLFRDRDELASASSLNEEIQDALRQSRNLLVICSPHAARSHWVGEEIKAFKAMGRQNRIFCVIVSGEPNTGGSADAATECFPAPLRFHVDAEGQLTDERIEPLAADAREHGDGKRNALLKVVAALLGVGFDSLKHRDQERRMRQMAIAGTVLLSAVVVLSGLSYYAFQQRNAAQREARAARAALSAQIATHSQLARQAFPQKSLLLAVEALNITGRFGEPPVAAAEEALRQALSEAGGEVLGAPGTPLESVALSPDGRWLATAAEESDARLWNVQAGASTASASAATVLSGGAPMAFSANSRWLVTTGRDGQPSALWDLASAAPRPSPRPLPGVAGPVAFSADNRWLITGGSDRSVRLWNLAHADVDAPIVLPPEVNPSAVVAVSPNSRWLATSSWTPNANRSETAVARLWDLAAAQPGTTAIELAGHSSSVTRLVFSLDNRWLVTSSAEQDSHTFRSDHTVRVWDLTRENPSQDPRVLSGHEGSITATAISADGRWLVTGSEDKTARLWDLSASDKNTGPQILAGHDNAIGSVFLGADARWIVTITSRPGWRDAAGSGVPTARFWEITTDGSPSTPTIFTDAGRPVTVVASSLSPDSRWLLLGSDAAAFVIDLTGAKPAESARVFRGHEGEVAAATFAADGRTAVTGSGDGTARVWRLAAAKASASPTVVTADRDEAFSVSASGRWLLTIGDPGARQRSDSVAVLRDLKAGDVAAAPIYLADHTEPLFAAVISEDERWIATAGADQTARLRRMGANGPASPVWTLKGHTGVVNALTFSRDGRRLASGSFDGSVRLWDLTADDPSLRPLVLTAHNTVFNVLIDRGSRWLASFGDALTPATLWDLQSSDPARSGRVLQDSAAGRLSADRRWLVTYGNDERRLLLEQQRRDSRPPRSADEARELRAMNERISRLPLITAVWDLNAADPVATRQVLAEAGEPAAFSPDGRWLVTDGSDETPRLWKLGTGGPAPSPLLLRGHQKALDAAAFDRSGRWLVTGSYDDTARLWDLQPVPPTSQLLATHASAVSTVAISRDDRWVFTASSQDGDLHLASLPGNTDPNRPLNLPMGNVDVWGAMFTDDGRWLITRSYDTHTLSVWTLDLEALVTLACRTAGRQLTQAEWEQYFPGQTYTNVCR